VESAKPKKTILIVDDDDQFQLPSLVEIATSFLGKKEWQVVYANSEREARDILKRLPTLEIAVIDLYLSDPPVHKEGLSLLDEIKRRFGNHCYRILVSARINDLAEAQVERGFDLFHEFVYLKRLNNVNPFDRIVGALTNGLRPRADLATV
jgi:ActR/RegA family two-component response regulator